MEGRERGSGGRRKEGSKRREKKREEKEGRKGRERGDVGKGKVWEEGGKEEEGIRDWSVNGVKKCDIKI